MKSKELFETFFAYDPQQDIDSLSTLPEETWWKIGAGKALENFHIAAQRVPAYKRFLAEQNVDVNAIVTEEDFVTKVPFIDKQNYLYRYPLSEMVLDGDIGKSTVFHFSSGSSGKPSYMAKSVEMDIATAQAVELVFEYYFQVGSTSTLVVNGLAMGPWSAGEVIHNSSKLLAQKGLPISVVSPGANSNLILTVLRDIADHYDQVIVTGYPSFLRDLAQTIIAADMPMKKGLVKIVTGGEKNSQSWRRTLAVAFNFDESTANVLSMVGMSECGVLSFSTPFADYVGSYLTSHPQEQARLLDRVDEPSVTHFLPPARYIEIVEGEVVLTNGGFMPLIRYRTRDGGKIFSAGQLWDEMPSDFRQGWEKLGMPQARPTLPILTIDGRIDQTIILYGANIYPEQIEAIVGQEADGWLTGRFLTSKSEKEDGESVWRLVLELKEGVKVEDELADKLSEIICATMLKINSEYAYIWERVGLAARPQVSLAECGSADIRKLSGKGITTILEKST